MFAVRVARPADRALARLAPATAQRIERALSNLKEDPYRPRPGTDIKMLHGERNYYRLRVGDYRAFYHVFPEEQVVVVVDVRHRSRAYD